MFPVILPCIAAGSVYALVVSITSIRNVRKYESVTKTAAQYSNIAEDQLTNTRTTEAAGALSTAVSLLTSVAFTFYPSQSPVEHVMLSAFNTAALWFAADHISRFWRGKAKVPAPGLQQYNDAISQMDTLNRVMMGLAVAWVLDAGVGVWGLIAG